jgi:hypothetical protein
MYNNRLGIPQACCCDTDSPYLIRWPKETLGAYRCLPNDKYSDFKQYIVPGINGSIDSSSPCLNPSCNDSRCTGNTCNDPVRPQDVTTCKTDLCTITGADMFNYQTGEYHACCCKTDMPYSVHNTSGCKYVCLNESEVQEGTKYQDNIFCNNSRVSTSPCNNPVCSDTNCADNKCGIDPEVCITPCASTQTCKSGVCVDTYCWAGNWGPIPERNDMYHYKDQNNGAPICCQSGLLPYLSFISGNCSFICLDPDSISPEDMRKDPDSWCGKTGPVSPCLNPVYNCDSTGKDRCCEE